MVLKVKGLFLINPHQTTTCPARPINRREPHLAEADRGIAPVGEPARVTTTA
jgi:hypothetical protein